MKVLIWIGCFIVASILNVILGAVSGVKAGYVVFYLAVGHVAKKLCNKWDEHKAAKAAQKEPKAPAPDSAVPSQESAETKPTLGYCRYCGQELLEGSHFCRKCNSRIL